MDVHGTICGTLSSAGRITGALSSAGEMTGTLIIPSAILPPAYEGEYTVTPSAVAQVLPTAEVWLTDNITVQPIPQNYGLITYDGSIITVS